jgi:hypothetical protein
MIDENGTVLTEKEIIKDIMEILTEALCPAYELKSDNGHALAWMIDCALQYAKVIYRDFDVLSASADYTRYEENMADIKKLDANLRVIKND